MKNEEYTVKMNVCISLNYENIAATDSETARENALKKSLSAVNWGEGCGLYRHYRINGDGRLIPYTDMFSCSAIKCGKVRYGGYNILVFLSVMAGYENIIATSPADAVDKAKKMLENNISFNDDDVVWANFGITDVEIARKGKVIFSGYVSNVEDADIMKLESKTEMWRCKKKENVS